MIVRAGGHHRRPAAAPLRGPVPATPPRVAGLTRLRLLFISWVVVYHLDLLLGVTAEVPWLRTVVRAGYLGVDGFFLLSGFALWLGYGARRLDGPRDVALFLLRRFARTWPLHAVALLLLAALVGAAIAAGAVINEPERFSLRQFLLQLALVHAWETSHQLAWNSPTWALSAEWAGYLAFPLLLRGLHLLPPGAVVAVPASALGGLQVLACAEPGVGLNYTLHLGLARFGLEFCLGLALGRMATEGGLPTWTAPAATLALPLGLLAGQAAVTVAGLAALIAGVWQREARDGEIPARPGLLLALGEASFGTYICYVFVEAALVGVLRATEPGLGVRLSLMLGGFVACQALGWTAWRAVERPAQQWLLALVHGGR